MAVLLHDTNFTKILVGFIRSNINIYSNNSNKSTNTINNKNNNNITTTKL